MAIPHQPPETSVPLDAVYRALYDAWGPQGWWPGDGRLEMAVGAILTQNTAWRNVEKAIARLREADALSIERLDAAPLEQLTEWIRPAGYYNIKARRLRAFISLVANEFAGDLDRLLALPVPALRRTLLGVHGIGPETADSILLYAGGHPVFVVDAYTRRFMERHGWLAGKESYDQVAETFTRQLAPDTPMYNEFHALIVRLGKTHCRTRPDCRACPLRPFLPSHQG